MLVPVLSVAFVCAAAALRVDRVRYVSGLAGWSAAEQGAAWSPRLIIPGNQNPSFEWLDQARLMLDTGRLRIRHIDYENAPFGHDVRAASPYRWWLGALAWACHWATGRPLGPSLETAALIADPALYVLLIASAAAFAAWAFGALPAAVISAALAALFPLDVGFLPGAPDDQGLCLAAALWSVLPLLAGLLSPGRRRGWFAAAGVAGGLGLWIGVVGEGTVICGIAAGGLAAAWAGRGAAPDVPPWRLWACAGAATTLLAYLCEFFPSHLGSWDLRAVHPVHGIAWLGLGQIMHMLALRIQGARPASRLREAAWALAAAAAVAAPALVLGLTSARGFVTSDLGLMRLNRLSNGPAAVDLLALVIHDGFSPAVLATLLPAALLLPAGWMALRRSAGAEGRGLVALACGPAVAALGVALFKLSLWSTLDAALAGVACALTCALLREGAHRYVIWGWLALAAALAGPGLVQAWPPEETLGKNALVESEVIGLIERDLARWLAVHEPPGGGVVLAPGNATTALYYYGGLKGLGTVDWENQEGIQAAVRIVSATTADEAQDLVNRHGVTFIVIPSWDSQLDTFARMGLGQVDGSFINGLHRWVLPPWLRPVSYPLPVIGGFEGQSIVVFELTEDQDDALMLSRLAQYFVETDNLSLAASAANALRRFQADLGALIARAQVQVARGESEEFAKTVDALLARLTDASERTLPWDRRLSLAVVLAQAQQLSRARDTLRKCLAQADEEKIRSLSTASLYRLEVLARLLGMEVADPKIRELALALLPPDMAKRLK